MLRNPGIKENVFDRPGEGFSLFWCRSSVSLQKDDWEIKKEQCAGVWAAFLRWYVNDLLKHFFILVKEEQISIRLKGAGRALESVFIQLSLFKIQFAPLSLEWINF